MILQVLKLAIDKNASNLNQEKGRLYMKKQKIKLIAFSVSLVLCCAALIIINNIKMKKAVHNDVIWEAKIDYFDNLNEVEKASDIIVFGKKVYEKEPTTITDDNGATVAFYTLSGFKIQSIKKNSKTISVKKDRLYLY